MAELLRSSEVIQRLYEEEAAKYPEMDHSLTLPFLLSALIARIGNLDEFWDNVAEMRNKAGDYRKRRQELDHACASGSIRELKILQKAVRQETSALGEWLKSSFGTITGVLGVGLVAYQPKLGAAALTVQLAFAALRPWLEKNAPDWFHSAGRALVSPYSWFLQDTAKAATGLTNALPKIAELWSIQTEDVRGLDQLTMLSRWGIA